MRFAERSQVGKIHGHVLPRNLHSSPWPHDVHANAQAQPAPICLQRYPREFEDGRGRLGRGNLICRARADGADNVVGPFQLNSRRVRIGHHPCQRIARGKAGHQAQRRKPSRRNIGAQQDGKVQPAFRAFPHAALPPITRRLTPRAHGKPFGLARLKRALHHIVRGLHLIVCELPILQLTPRQAPRIDNQR